MNRTRSSLILLLALITPGIFLSFLFHSHASAQQTSATGKNLPNFQVINSQVGTCGQPTEDGWKEIVQKGYKTVLNLRTAEEGAEGERAIVEKLGLKYVNIPISPSTINDQAAGKFREVMRDKSSEPIFVHCRTASRVGGMMILYLVLDQKMSLEKAEKQAHQIGFTDAPWLKGFVLEYIKRHQSQ